MKTDCRHIEGYDINRDSLWHFINRSNKDKTRQVVSQDSSNHYYIDLRRLDKRHEFRKRIWLEACDNYYEIAEHINDSKFSRLLAKYTDTTRVSWYDFLQVGLFSYSQLDTESLSYEINNRLWKFYRLTRKIIRWSRR